MTGPSGDTPLFHALVLAAGAGARFGGGKLSASWRGAPLVAAAMAAARASPAAGVTLVTGCDPSLAQAAQDAGAGPFDVVHAADWAQGLSASLRAGWMAAPREAVGVFVFLGDMPRVPHGMAARLVPAFLAGALAAAPTCAGRRGHPVLIGRALGDAVERLRGDEGLGAILKTLGDRLALVPTRREGVLFDVDTPEALRTAG